MISKLLTSGKFEILMQSWRNMATVYGILRKNVENERRRLEIIKMINIIIILW